MLIKKPFGLVLILIFFPDLKQIALKTPTKKTARVAYHKL